MQTVFFVAYESQCILQQPGPLKSLVIWTTNMVFGCCSADRVGEGRRHQECRSLAVGKDSIGTQRVNLLSLRFPCVNCYMLWRELSHLYKRFRTSSFGIIVKQIDETITIGSIVSGL